MSAHHVLAGVQTVNATGTAGEAMTASPPSYRYAFGPENKFAFAPPADVLVVPPPHHSDILKVGDSIAVHKNGWMFPHEALCHEALCCLDYVRIRRDGITLYVGAFVRGRYASLSKKTMPFLQFEQLESVFLDFSPLYNFTRHVTSIQRKDDPKRFDRTWSNIVTSRDVELPIEIKF